MKEDDKLLEELAGIVHSGLAAGHLLAAYFNYRKTKRVDLWVAFHTAAAILDTKAVLTHLKRVQKART